MLENSNSFNLPKLTTPVLFIVFNRLDTTKMVLEAIREAKPSRIYIASDGPRKNRDGEDLIVNSVRNYIFKKIDWKCEIKTLFRNENLGCKFGVSSAIDWFFENEEMGIILEDDCVPEKSFFFFCEELLIKYKDDKRIWHIGGTNPISNLKISNSYYFSKYNRIWGWATWRRAWEYSDSSISIWPDVKKDKILYDLLSKEEATYFERIFDNVFFNKIDTWDYQWFLMRLLNGMAIIPNSNLVSNIGFNQEATHTANFNNKFSKLPTGKMEFPLKHPTIFIQDIQQDSIWSKEILKTNRKNIIINTLNYLKSKL